MLTLTLPQARALHLAAQGLDRRPRRRARKADVLAAIRNMGALQIDTIHVVARSPYLVLFSRLGSYDPDCLDQLLAEGRLFEYWSHEACFLPIEHFGIYRERMLEPEQLGWKNRGRWAAENQDRVDHVIAAIRERGPVRSADFRREDGKGGGWWQWKPEKRALEHLFTTGEVMVARRERFQRVYDLRERVLPWWNDAARPTPEESRRALVLHAVRALGIARTSWIADYFRMDRRGTPRIVEGLGASGELLRARVDAWDEEVWIHPDRWDLVVRSVAGDVKPTLTTLVSPFDPIVWDRRRALELFDFEYTLECYMPASKRRYGYFVLPILRKGALIGRLDAKAHRADGVFEVKSLFLERRTRRTEAVARDVARALRECAAWHRTPEIRFTGGAEPAFARTLARLLE